jgi:LysM repeat protein
MIGAMTDRAIPSADSAPACPFVAFDDDRDARSTAPDHRHRCFAEPVPAPRAIAHQNAYCLSPSFAVCPAFQDWARREAAAARPAASAPTPAPRAREEDTSGLVPMPPAEREPRHAPASAAQPLPSRKAPPRDWAAPPPWVDEDAGDELDEAASAAPGAIPGWGAAAAGAAIGGGAPASRPHGHDDWGDASRGLADSPAARLAGPDRDLPAPARPTPSWEPPLAGDEDDEDADVPYADALPGAVPPSRPQSNAVKPLGSRSAAGAPSPSRPVRPPATPPSRDGVRPGARDANELFGPAWERPRRYEAYPTLKTRVGLPSLRGVPRLGIAAVALVVAAAFLFFVSPMILGLGKNSTPGASGQPSAGASTAPLDTPLPTVAPAPTAQVYTVRSGDTLSAIAQRFNTTLKALLAANPKIKNANSIKVGDKITIPAPSGASSSGAVGGASPSAVEGASTAP